MHVEIWESTCVVQCKIWRIYYLTTTQYSKVEEIVREMLRLNTCPVVGTRAAITALSELLFLLSASPPIAASGSDHSSSLLSTLFTGFNLLFYSGNFPFTIFWGTYLFTLLYCNILIPMLIINRWCLINSIVYIGHISSNFIFNFYPYYYISMNVFNSTSSIS